MTTRTEAAIAQNVTIDDICRQAVDRIKALRTLLTQDTDSKDTFADVFSELRLILESLPLNTDEFGVAGNRLRNAARYLKSGERGAACYELNLLSRNLDQDRHNRVTVRCRKRY